MNTNPVFNTLIEGIVYNIADTEGFWQGDTQFQCGVFAEVYLDAKALAVIEFMIPGAIALPHFWIVQKFPIVRCISFPTQDGLQKWWDTLYEEQTHWTMELFDEPALIGETYGH